MGNKWRKLKFNLIEAKAQKKDRLVTFGGAYSNHVVAVACAARLYGFKSLGLIRGHELNPESNPTLKSAADYGMELHFLTRENYKFLTKEMENPKNPQDYLIPEGGTNALALRGVREMTEEPGFSEYDIVTCPIGTGGTFCGILQGLNGRGQVWGFSALKGDSITDETRAQRLAFDIHFENYQIFSNYHFGGYARFTPELIAFINSFKKEFNVLLDPIYTGKMFFGVWDKIKNDQIAPGSRILLVHTGGIQGIDGFNLRHHDVKLGK